MRKITSSPADLSLIRTRPDKNNGAQPRLCEYYDEFRKGCDSAVPDADELEDVVLESRALGLHRSCALQITGETDAEEAIFVRGEHGWRALLAEELDERMRFRQPECTQSASSLKFCLAVEILKDFPRSRRRNGFTPSRSWPARADAISRRRRVLCRTRYSL